MMLRMLCSGRSFLCRRSAVAVVVTLLALPAGLPGTPAQAAVALPRAVAAAPHTLVDEGDGVRALDVALTQPTSARAERGRYRSEVVTASSPFSMVGLTWTGGPREVRVRVRSQGSWSGWQELEMLTDGPDLGSGEGNGRAATDLRWVASATAVRVEVSGGRPDDLRLTLMEPGRVAHASPVSARPRSGDKHPKRPRPDLLNRGAWGADPQLRSGRPIINRTIQQVHVHHTVNSNDYRRSDVPGLLRGIYRYHTQNLGWSDIGYNFLVDRFGRTWVGRAGGAKQAVRGAHTLGFNSTSTGVAVIGNFETGNPGHRVVTALVKLAAWKLHRNRRAPNGKVRVYSHGSDRYRAGTTVRLPAIDGHRDTNETACPGSRLYRHLPTIRRRAAEREARFG